MAGKRQRRPRPDRKPPKPGEVTVARLPIVKCGERGCKWSKAVLPGQNASKLLTAHYKDRHAPPGTS